MTETTKLHPITEWKIGPIVTHRLIAFQPHFLSVPNQTLEQAQQGQMYALTIKQAQDLIVDLQRSIDILQKSQ